MGTQLGKKPHFTQVNLSNDMSSRLSGSRVNNFHVTSSAFGSDLGRGDTIDKSWALCTFLALANYQ